MKRILTIICLFLIMSMAPALAVDYSNPNEDGSNFGLEVGKEAGKKDAESKSENDYENAMKSSKREALKAYFEYQSFSTETSEAFILNMPSNYEDDFYSGYKSGYKSSYETAYEEVEKEEEEGETPEEIGEEKGKTAGDSDGRIAGRKDADDEAESDWEEALYEDGDDDLDYVEDRYNLDNETKEYKKAFLEAYEKAFKTAYQKQYSDTNFDNASGKSEEEEESNRTSGLESGAMFGENDGFRAAINDYHKGNDSDAEDAMPSESKIKSKFALGAQTSEYSLYFIKGYKESFITGYEKGFRNANMDPRETAYNNGFEFGNEMGSRDGKADGLKSYYNNATNNWLELIKSDDYLKTHYELYKEIDEYQQGFLNGYKVSYRMSYVENYKQSKVDYFDEKSKRAYDAGSAVGSQNGQYFGQNDYVNGRMNNWKTSIESDFEISDKYNLSKETIDYVNTFIAAYKESFMKNYIESYQNASKDTLTQNVEFVEINGFGGEVKYESTDKFEEVCNLEVQPGSVLRKTSFAIEKREYLPYYFLDKYVPITNVYQVTLKNGKDSVNLNKPLKISFKYYGPMDAGIYKKENGKWLYVDSQVYRTDDDSFIVSADINNKEYNGGKYVVMVDENYNQLEDIDGHWAEKEIDIFLRRKYVSGYPDKTFRPNYKVTRAEFVKILDNVLNLNPSGTNYTLGTTTFKDSITFGVFGSSIMDAYTKGLINGYPDGTFRPNMQISYQEIEWIMKKLPNNSDFKWSEIQKKMQEDEGVVSNSSRGLNEKINRAEVIYMLNDIINEEIGE